MSYATPLLVAILVTLASAHSHHRHHEHTHDHEHEHLHGHIQSINRGHTSLEVDNVWLYAIGSSVVVGIAPIAILSFISIQPGSLSLNTFLAFAVGGLLGDVFLHILPHAITPHRHTGSGEHSHDSSWGLQLIAGFLLFFLIDKFVRAYSGSVHSHGKKDDDALPTSSASLIATRYLNMAADFAHNFTDGMAIGSAFSSTNSYHVGMTTVLAILLHEVPHEIGDFAILIQSGMSKRSAMWVQVVTAIGAVLGTVVGIIVEGSTDGVSWVMPFTAGGFLYIATVAVIPELLDATSGTKSPIVQAAKEVAALCFGVGLMLLVGLLE